MSRPGSSARSEDGPIAGPSRSPANDFYIQQQHDASKGWQSYPHHGTQEEEGEFLPMEGQDAYIQTTPYHPQHPLSHPPSHHPHHLQYTNGYPVPPSTSPTAMMGQHNQHPMLHITTTSPNDGFHMHSTPVPQHYYNGPPPPRRPGMPHRHSALPPTRPAPLQRQYSLQPPPSRVMDPAGHDVFAMPPGSTPIRRPASANGFQVENQFFSIPQGISPARALGPAPVQRPQFSPTADPLITPQTKQFPQNIPSSAASTAMTESSTMTSIASERRRSDSTEGETESPTRKGQDMDEMILIEPPKRVIIAPVRLKGVIGGRTSAKFAKVADDPGVEGVPPGPRPTERPTPSFACIIGQAILRCSAGGLSLEHIYRYVETAYPFFKSGDGAWRNSVRHNLSIHKMFETIPRTEHFPPGKGGIWIIHEEEKIHWPSEDKFIKNFPPSHPHHAVCRQTLHERSKEMEAIAKAQAEGRVYVPKKGKKGKKNEDGSGSADMIRGNSSMSEGAGPGPSSSAFIQQQQPPMQVHHQQMIHPMPTQPIVESTTPKMPPKIMHPPPFFPTLEDEGTYAEPMIPQGTMVPPRFGQKRPIDEENVFTSAPKRVRVDPSPLAPLPIQETEPDAYVTPERERQKAMMTSSAFKTPGLVNTSSSPGSSPMPTILRTANHHHPSALQQAWTHDDMSPNTPLSLDAAFDIQPKPKSKRLDDEYNPHPTSMHHHHHHHSPRAPPKTPLTRSSAAADRNMRTPFLAKTPMMYSGSPIMPRMTGYEMSTPAWEMEGILDRLRDYPTGPGAAAASMAIFSPAMRSPTRSSSTTMPLGLRSPLTSTDPSKYAGSANGASPTKGKFKATTSILGEVEGSTSPTSEKAVLPSTSPKIPPPANLLASKGMTIGRQLEVGRRERERTRSGEVPAGV